MCEILRETFFGGAHIEVESFDEVFRDDVEQNVHDLKENKSKDGDEFLNRSITWNVSFMPDGMPLQNNTNQRPNGPVNAHPISGPSKSTKHTKPEENNKVKK